MKRLAGSPLVIWTLEAVASAKLVEGVLVTSDDPDLLAAAQLYDKVRTIWREPALAGDDVPDHPVIMDALYRGPFNLAADDIVLLLRPTAPFRMPEEIDSVAVMLQSQPTVDSVRSILRPKYHPQKAYLWSPHMLIRYTADHRANHPSQGLDPVCYAAGFIDAVRYRVLAEGDMEGAVIKPWPTAPERCVDLDTEEDWTEAERLALAHQWAPGRCT